MALWRTTFLVMVVLGVCGFTLEEGTVTDSVTTVITDPPAGQPAEERQRRINCLSRMMAVGIFWDRPKSILTKSRDCFKRMFHNLLRTCQARR